MRRWSYLAVFCCVGCILFAGDLNPSSPPGAGGTMKTLDQVEPRIPIPGSAKATSSFVINQSGSYYLTGDRLCSQHGIYIAAENVTIDLCGYSLIGPVTTGVGLYFDNAKNVEVRNGTLYNFNYCCAMLGAPAENCRLFQLRVHDCDIGIMMSGQNHQVIGCTIADCTQRGMSVGTNSRVEGNNISGNTTYGISADVGSIVSNNTVYNNGSYGIYAYSGSTVRGNTVYSNGDYGIQTSEGCVIQDNVVRSNQDKGIVTSTACTIQNNTVALNTGKGIDSGSACVISGNSVSLNNGDGIEAGTGSTVSGNTVMSNDDHGIDGASSLIRDNQVTGNNLALAVNGAGIFARNHCQVIGNNLSGNRNNNIYVYSYGNFIESNTMYGSTLVNYGIYFNSSTNYYKGNRARYHTTDSYGGLLPTGDADGGDNVDL